ncbi:hypothetical protein [Lederbergia citrea]|uniref:Uncharacterized protein n=1 Tax=Lederbergia citrea TaxID=2833581 RepID=A0A942Z5V8_9BACI|nr:hypothetical protein [Lederbergia citrea]MBS4223845.1 hypothetical protein [Lederbergia citrea]
MIRKKKEGNHYRNRKTKEKEYYSLRSLVPEITGIEVDDAYFDSTHKAIQRIVKTFQSLEGIDKGTLKIHKDQKAGFVKATKAFYEKDKYRDILGKLRNGNPLTIEESDLLIEHFYESMKSELTREEAKKVEEQIENLKGDQFYEKRDQIEQLIIKDMQMVDNIKDYPTKLRYMEEYKEALNQVLQKWRKDVQYRVMSERAYERVVQQNPNFLQDEPFSSDNITPELLIKLMHEAILMQHEEDTKK